MRVAEHERIKLIDDIKWVEATNRATDEKRERLAIARQLEAANEQIKRLENTIETRLVEIHEGYAADAEKWRDRAERERKRGQAKRKGTGK